MRMLLLLFFFSLTVVAVKAQDSLELAPPLIKYPSIFFDSKTKAEIKFAQPGATVYYTLNGKEPDSKSSRYKEPILITKNYTQLKAKAIGEGFKSSVTSAVTFIKDGLPVLNTVFTVADSMYPGNGVNPLTDNKGGSDQLTANTWLGYYCDTVNILVTLQKKQEITSVLMNFLQNQSSWIFLPEKITVDYFDYKTGGYLTGVEESYADEKEASGSQCVNKTIYLETGSVTDKLLLHLFVRKSIPAWHSAKGSHAWMFIDEIKVY